MNPEERVSIGEMISGCCFLWLWVVPGLMPGPVAGVLGGGAGWFAIFGYFPVCGSGLSFWLSVGVVVGGGAVGHGHCCCSLFVEGDGGVVGVDPAVVVFAGGQQVVEVGAAAVVPVGDVVCVTVGDGYVAVGVKTRRVHGFKSLSLGGAGITSSPAYIYCDAVAVVKDRGECRVARHFLDLSDGDGGAVGVFADACLHGGR
jgi:hypothetical protein